MSIPEGEEKEKGTESICKAIMAKKSQNLEKRKEHPDP